MDDFDKLRLASGTRWRKGPFGVLCETLADAERVGESLTQDTEGALSLAAWLQRVSCFRQTSTKGNHSRVLQWHTMPQREDQKTKEGETVPEGRIISSRGMLKKSLSVTEWKLNVSV